MSSPLDRIHSDTSRARARLILTGEFAIAAVLLFTGMITFPEFPSVDLDPSWRIVLSHAFYHHFQFGHQLVFTHGPLGFLMGNTYAGEHFWTLIGWQVFRGVLFTCILLGVAKDLPVVARWIFFSCFLLFGFYFEYTLHLVVVLLASLRAMKRTTAPGILYCIVFGLGLAFLSTIKFLTLLLAAFAVVLVGISFWRRSWRRAAIWTATGYAVGFLLIWSGTHQDLSNLPEYFLNSWWISQGYAASMALPPPVGATEKGVGVLLLCALFLIVYLSTGKTQVQRWLEAALISAYVFIIWKHGFVRADGHMAGFFIGMLLPATCMPAVLDQPQRLRAFKWGLAGLWGGLSLWGLDHAETISKNNAWTTYRDKITGNIQHMRNWKSFRQSYETQIEQILKEKPLREIRGIVEDFTIDMLGHEAGLICLHRLNYRPRPVFQSYSAYSPSLDLLNLRYVQSNEAPRFILQKIQSIDSRLMSLDDASVLRVLPGLYEFVLMEDGYILWRRRLKPSAPESAPLPVILNGTQKPNATLSLVECADTPLWMTIDLPLTLLGRVRSFLYQPPIVELLLTESDGKTSRCRLPLSQAENGFLVNPIIEDPTGYLHFATRTNVRHTQTVAVSIKPEALKFVADEFNFSIRKVIQPYSAQPLSEIRATLFRHFKPRPDSETAFVLPAETFIDGSSVTLMHAPSEMQFSLQSNPVRISGSFGFVERAYTSGGQTDGATFEIIWTDRSRSTVLFSRFLDPLHVATDRGLQSFSVDLKKLHAGQLILKTGPGPTGNNGWDWTVWADIEIQQSN